MAFLVVFTISGEQNLYKLLNMALFNLGDVVTARPNGGELVTGKITFIRIEMYNPGGGLPDVKKEYYTIVGGGHKTKVREYEILTVKF